MHSQKKQTPKDIMKYNELDAEGLYAVNNEDTCMGQPATESETFACAPTLRAKCFRPSSREA